MNGTTNRKKRKELPEAVAQGKVEQTDYEKAVAANEPVEPKVQQPQPKGVLRRVAEFGLTPAAFAARQLNKVLKLTDENLTTSQIASATADTPIGYALGLGTVAAEAYLGGRLAARYIPSVGRAARKVKVPGIRGGTKVPHVSNKAIDAAAKRAGLSRAGVGQVKRQLGKMRVSEIANSLKNSQGTLLSRYARGAFSLKRAGSAILLGWLGADTLAQSTSIQASATESNVIFGQLSKSEGLSNLDRLQTYNNVAKGAILAAGVISPAAIPFLIFGWQSTKLSENQIDRSRNVIERL